MNDPVIEAAQTAAEEKELEAPLGDEQLVDENLGNEPEVVEKIEKPKDTLETLRPSDLPKTRTVGVGDKAVKFTQQPLSFFGKMDFYALIGETLDEAMGGPDGLSLDALLDGVGAGGEELTAADFMAADSMVKAIGKLARYAPQLLIDSYTIWLDVPLKQRAWFKQTVVRPVHEGGLSDEEGIDILTTFIAQNAEAIEAFFTVHLPLVSKEYRKSRAGK